MRIGILAIGMTILIAASAIVIVSSATKDGDIELNDDTVIFSSFEEDTKIKVQVRSADNNNGDTNQYQYQYNYTWQNENRHRVQFVGDDTYSSGYDYAMELGVGTFYFKATASTPNNNNIVELDGEFDIL